MNIETVIRELGLLRAEFNIRAYEAGDVETEKRWSGRAEVVAAALEYLWQYQDLME